MDKKASQEISHKIVDAEWTPRVNLLVIECSLVGDTFQHRADRWNADCPFCGATIHLQSLRNAFPVEKQ